MSLTVSDVYAKFPQFKRNDMESLIGRKNFTDNDTISLSRIASYTGTASEDLSIFAAQKEGETFVNMLSDTKKEKITPQLSLSNDKNKSDNIQNKSGQIPMNTSIFDIKKREE